MQGLNFLHDGFHLVACVIFGLKQPHPHVMVMVVDDEQTIAEVMWGGDINRARKVR
jgi:hypothetical protein